MAVPTSGAAEAEVCAGTGDEVAGHIGKSLVAVAGVIAQQGEGLVHIHPETLGELPLGLLDDNPAAKGCLELLGDVSLRRTFRSCNSPMVATSASAWPTRSSAGSNRPGSARNSSSSPPR
jgi:hypothetical protein